MNTRLMVIAPLAFLPLSNGAQAQQKPDLVLASDRFSWVRGAVQHGPLLYVNDREPEVFVFSIDDGGVRTSLGGKGGGPGEFANVAQIGVRGDTVWAYDARLRRVQLFLDGRFISAISTGTISDIVNSILPDGSFLTRQLEDWHAIGAGAQRSITFTKRDRNLTAETPLIRHAVSTADVIRANPSNDPSRPGGYHATSPLAPSDIVRISANGAALFRVNRTTYSVTRIDPVTGRDIWAQKYNHQPRRMTSQLRQHIISDVLEEADNPMLRRQYASEAAMRESLEKAIQFPRTLPPVTDAVAGTDGSLWVRREYSAGEVAMWDVISPAGTVIRSLQLPVGFTGLSAGPGYIWGMAKGELDVPVVVRYRSN